MNGPVYILSDKPWPGSGYRPLIEITTQPNMRRKRLRNGQTAYYWRPPRKVNRQGLPIFAEPLGTDFVEAGKRALKLNALCDAFPAESQSKSEGIRAV
jgi:hypothetical protein